MTEIEQILLKLEIKGVEDIIKFHVKKAEIEGLASNQQAHIDDILEYLHELYQKLKEAENE